MRLTTLVTLAMIVFLVFPAQAADHDRDLSRWIKSWKTSHTYLTHGNLIERAILTQGDPINPPTQGAVLKYLSKLSHASLLGMAFTKAVKHEDENEVMYVASGNGRIEAGGKTVKIKPGDGILIPRGLEHQIFNETHESLELIVATEKVPEDFKAREDLLVKNAFDSKSFDSSHWCHMGHPLFDRRDGLYQLEGFGLVAIDGMNIAHPHNHIEGHEEIWYQLTGDSYLLLGKQLYKQPEGTAFLTPPDGETPHSSINTTDKPMLWLFFARWNPPK